MTDTVATGLAAGAAVLQGLLAVLLLVALAALVSPRARRMLVEARELLFGGELWIAWALAAIATGGSLFFSEYSNFLPCRLCWFQRIAMYPMAIVLLGTAIRRDIRGAVLYALPLPVLGAVVSGYHIYIEHHPEAETQGCLASAPGGCATRWIEKFGYITIPVLAITAFAAIATLLAMAWTRRERATGAALDEPDEQGLSAA